MRKKLVVLSGAGISAESGINTFRDSNGLWENHDIMEVASPEGWERNKELVLNFYNQRRKQERECQPNEAHKILAELEEHFDVQIITQNIDSLHERAGSSAILHLHGEINKAQSSLDPELVYEMDHWEIKKGDKCEKGSQLRPHVVWFGEPVPKMLDAVEITQQADIFLVIGTSLQVYPAASLLDYVGENCPIYLIDPKQPEYKLPKKVISIQENATVGMKKVKDLLIHRQ
ncbi:NAD-dependent deacetylase [Algoriphagus faecimaris]|uniref:protein acetyllysine N-acetyltransferase n=1 Tax=Algoriphagus faecimaris TaxID=686796 RepID=A0A1G6TVV1_9BACT|nr:NAD-dependent deacylase [Algoriphagus faecimaris]SDD32435.1 NAD-dependent deacetylase [Algoriphagus faecimaris]